MKDEKLKQKAKKYADEKQIKSKLLEQAYEQGYRDALKELKELKEINKKKDNDYI